MWTANNAPARPSRTPSVHSIAMHSASRPQSTAASPQFQRRNTGYDSDTSSTATEDDISNFPSVPNRGNVPPMWDSQRQQSGSAVSRLSRKFISHVPVAEIAAPPPLYNQPLREQMPIQNSPEDDAQSRSSTLGDSEAEQDFEFPEKTPTSKRFHAPPIDIDLDRPAAPAAAPHVPGPLESQLATLMSKLIFMERENPVVSITPEDFESMQAELQALREEKKTWQKRHEALYALRDEDVDNNIKIRGMLAKARRELEGMTKLRDEDLVNVQLVRSKLADATRKLERFEAQPGAGANGRASPSKARPGSMFMERRNTADLFAAAQAAAFQQRALELENKNAELLGQIEQLKGGASIDTLNSIAAHEAWKDTVSELERKLKSKDAELVRLRSSSASSGLGATTVNSGTAQWHKIEAIYDEHAGYRERVGGRMQALRSEKEGLQKELHRREDECHALEVRVKSLERRLATVVT